MNFKILIPILAIVLVSGCTIPGLENLSVGQTAGTAGNGLEITSFTADPSTVFSGSSVRLIMEVENQGGTTVENDKDMVYLTGSNFDSWGGTTYTHFDKTMKSSDVVRDIPADTKRFSWSVRAPTLTAGQTRTDTFIGRVYHDYQTSANGNVWVYSESEAEAARTSGRPLYTPSFTYTKGPVGLSVSVSPTPVILYSGEATFTLYIKLSNLATGTIYHTGSVTYATGSESVKIDPSQDQLNWVNVAVTGSDLTLGDGCTGDQELVAGKEATLVCEVTVNSAPDTFKSYALDVTVSYGYFTERTVSVTVQGK